MLEAESQALRRFLADWPLRAASALARLEVERALLRSAVGKPAGEQEAAIWSGVTLLALGHEVLRVAARLPPPALRALDAIHLASALALGEDLSGLVTYGRRLSEAARGAGVRTWSPR